MYRLFFSLSLRLFNGAADRKESIELNAFLTRKVCIVASAARVKLYRVRLVFDRGAIAAADAEKCRGMKIEQCMSA